LYFFNALTNTDFQNSSILTSHTVVGKWQFNLGIIFIVLKVDVESYYGFVDITLCDKL
jgi:hypothetical protein